MCILIFIHFVTCLNLITTISLGFSKSFRDRLDKVKLAIVDHFLVVLAQHTLVRFSRIVLLDIVKLD